MYIVLFNEASQRRQQTRHKISVSTIPPEIATRLGITQGKRVAVLVVNSGSFAQAIGVEVRDVILDINKQPVSSEEDLDRIEPS